jgi:hypothetical protein
MAITLDYPNAYDRLEGKSGDGIWLHATNEPIRPYLPNKTRGCVVISNDDIQELSGLLAQLLEQLLREESNSSHAERRLAQRLDAGMDLGTNGRVTWTREELHER